MAKGDFHDPHDFSDSFRNVRFIRWNVPTEKLMQNVVTNFHFDETFVWLYKYDMKFLIHNN
jgi:hypothetical protein